MPRKDKARARTPRGMRRRERKKKPRLVVPGRPTRVLGDDWIDAIQISQWLSVSKNWVYRHMSFMAVKVNRRDFRWKREIVQRWLSDITD